MKKKAQKNFEKKSEEFYAKQALFFDFDTANKYLLLNLIKLARYYKKMIEQLINNSSASIKK